MSQKQKNKAAAGKAARKQRTQEKLEARRERQNGEKQGYDASMFIHSDTRGFMNLPKRKPTVTGAAIGIHDTMIDSFIDSWTMKDSYNLLKQGGITKNSDLKGVRSIKFSRQPEYEFVNKYHKRNAKR